MMKIRILTPEERNTCYGHYRNNDLFRHFLPILNEIGRHVTGVDALAGIALVLELYSRPEDLPERIPQNQIPLALSQFGTLARQGGTTFHTATTKL